MPYTMQQHLERYTVVTTFQGDISREDMINWQADVDRLIAGFDTNNLPPKYFHIMDVREAEISFPDLLFALRSGAIEPAPLMFAPEDFHILFVGHHQMAKLAVNLLQQVRFGGIQAPMFHDLEAALAYIDTEIGNMA